MTVYDIRYSFEHRILPAWFYKHKGQFTGLLLKDKNVLYEIIDDMFKDAEMENPFTRDDFDIVAARLSNEIMMLKIIFPAPDQEPLCYCSYLFFDQNFERTSYFCIEKGGSIEPDKPYVCGWTADGKHQNYGNCTFDENDDFLRCLNLHISKS